MTPTSPTWADVKAFPAADEWRELLSAARGGKSADHIFYEKALPDGRVLQTHVSHSANKTLSAGRFRDTLHHQLEVSKDAFCEAVRTGDPVSRPAPVEATEPFQHPAWVVAVLAGKLHMTGEDIAKPSPEEAEARVQEFWTTGEWRVAPAAPRGKPGSMSDHRARRATSRDSRPKRWPAT